MNQKWAIITSVF